MTDLEDAPAQDGGLGIDFPTDDHDHPDRILLRWDTDELPVTVKDYLPGS